MQPSQPLQAATPTADPLRLKWRHIPPQATLWVLNPFNHDVIFQVADELNRPFLYKLGANSRSELPGGTIATLGLKHLVDEMIQNEKTHILSLHDLNVRAEYEARIIIKEKAAPTNTNQVGPVGEIDLSVSDDLELPDTIETPVAAAPPPQAFPGLTQAPSVIQGHQASPVPVAAPAIAPGPAPANPDVAVTIAGLPEVGEVGANNTTNEE